MRTQVGIVGAGPAGLLLGHLLKAAGIDAVIVERQTRARVQERIRAGVLERTTTDLLHRLGIDARLDAEGLPHDGFALADDGRLIRIDVAALTGGHVTVYGQTEVTRDLIDAAGPRDLPILWESPVAAIEGIDGDRPVIVHGEGGAQRLECDFVAGCDGFHGAGRQAMPASVRRVFERAYPFGWLGVLADVPPCDGELIYASHDRGFALASMRSPTRSRYYLQVGLDERLEDWPDERFWEELSTRLGDGVAARVTRGPSIEKSIAPLRSFVAEPMRHGRLFLAGDAAHIVPPTGAKGLNLASSDVAYLSEALIGWYSRGDEAGLAGYGARALARVWKSERFSWYLTKLMHRFPEDGAFERRMQTAELDYIAGSTAAQTSIAENYVGLPL
ncbi:4-hydroxybenzoate 3-monooxygenase [Sphingomonas bacterium]|uniref:4-hydroxybenzoate 3-monooxygenase n=1 Tax=Sphingomonas bacterium TaxID=1895847 RepID=UPI0015769EED|nr:4-hydroxybenzoate 3-monooxygenase [Sphingomonas bacterium]